MNSATLIFEGVDRCGKSSLIEGWRKQFHHYKLEKMRVPCALSEAVMWYEEYFDDLCGVFGSKVWDRGHLSEVVYAQLYKNYCHFNWPSTIWMMEEARIRTQPTFIVYVYPVWYQLLGLDERPNANLQRELSAYDVALGATSLPVIDITKHCTDRVAWREQSDVLIELRDKVEEQVDLWHAKRSNQER